MAAAAPMILSTIASQVVGGFVSKAMAPKEKAAPAPVAPTMEPEKKQPDPDSTGIAAAERVRQASAQRRGRSSTILTGLPQTAVNNASTTVLGG
jgi:hypothetical protein